MPITQEMANRYVPHEIQQMHDPQVYGWHTYKFKV
jgi:hypothetical protein